MTDGKATPADEGPVAERHLATPAEQARDDRLFHEINLLKIEGRYFTFARAPRGRSARPSGDPVQPLPDLKEVKRQLQAAGKTDESVFIVTPHPDRGQPGELAYKVLQVVLKRISELRFTALDSVKFSFRELAQLCGRSTFGGKDVKELARAIDQLLTTVVTVGFYNKPSKKWAVHQFTVVNSVPYRGDDKENPGDPEGAVMLHPLFIKSLQDGHFLCLNFTRFGTLTEAITQALYKRLYFHFSNIHHKHPRETFPVFRKAYEDICREWLSGLTPLKHRSRILQEQLGRHLEQLKRLGLIASYDVLKSKDGAGFNLECSPGDAFFEDYQRFYTAQIAAPTIRLLPLAPEPGPLPEAELAAYFYEKKYGTPAAGSVATVAAGDIEFARLLMDKLSILECRGFINFALSEAAATNFDVRTFRGIAQYHPAFLAKRDEQTRKRSDDEARRKQREAGLQEEDLLAQYDTFKRTEVERIRSSLTGSTLSDLEEHFRAKMRQGPVRFKNAEGRLLRIAVDDQLASDHGLPSFEEWKVCQTRGVQH